MNDLNKQIILDKILTNEPLDILESDDDKLALRHATAIVW